VPGIVDLQQAELTYRGFTPAVLSSFRGMLSGALAPHHRAIAKAGIPVLTVLGEADALIPVTIADTLKEWHPTARVEVIEGAGHGVTYTHADQVMGHIKAFLTS
jgi:pimeloyl-ACP methyl ester carboxylesterase